MQHYVMSVVSLQLTSLVQHFTNKEPEIYSMSPGVGAREAKHVNAT